MRNKKLSHAIAAILAAVLAAGVTIAVTSGDEGTTLTIKIPKVPVVSVQAQAPPEVIAVDGPDKDAKPDDPVVLSDEAQDFATTVSEKPRDLEPEGLRGPDNTAVAELQPPFASDTLPGCETRTFTTNWSQRTAPIKAIALHYTAGADIPNSRAEVTGLTAFGNNPASAVSWAANLDKDGNCDYNVPLRYKAWTIGGLNSQTINFEVAGRGDAPYMRPEGYKEMARIYLEIKRRYGIPLRLGAVDGNCNVTRTGFITHWMGGPCSGGHVDIKPLDLAAVLREIAKYVRVLECDAACKKAKRATQLRAKHQRTHERFRKNECSTGGKDGKPKVGGYCQRLRNRNKAVHAAARREGISLKGTF